MIEDKKKYFHTTLIPILFLAICWMTFFLEFSLNISFSHYGLFPRDLSHIYGIITMPFLHNDIKHLIANSIPFFVLLSFIFYFYNEIAFKIFFLTFLFSGLFTWIIGRSSFHIGASALIYSYTSFLITAGIISKNIRLLASSLLVVFLYGGIIWGILPVDNNVSWEGHLSGFVTGLLIAFIYRKKLPKSEVILLEEEDEDDDDNNYYLDDNYNQLDNENVDSKPN